jgi:hypothetical protein
MTVSFSLPPALLSACNKCNTQSRRLAFTQILNQTDAIRNTGAYCSQQ